MVFRASGHRLGSNFRRLARTAAVNDDGSGQGTRFNHRTFTANALKTRNGCQFNSISLSQWPPRSITHPLSSTASKTLSTSSAPFLNASICFLASIALTCPTVGPDDALIAVKTTGELHCLPSLLSDERSRHLWLRCAFALSTRPCLF